MAREYKSAGFDKSLALHWGDFVGCERRRQTMLPFLMHVFAESQNPRVVDLAAGIGCDVVGLAGLGIRVVGNEIDPALRELAEARAAKEGVECRWTNVDWTELRAGLGNAAFDGLLLLGNSFCLLMDEGDRQAAAQEMFGLCSRGGRLVVDERNFRYLLRDRDSILRGSFRYGRRVVYCGTGVRGTPSAIKDDLVVVSYEDEKSGTVYGSLRMHPFAQGELERLFCGVGFELIGVYSDLVGGYRDDADFYTYVFQVSSPGLPPAFETASERADRNAHQQAMFRRCLNGELGY